MIPGLTWVSKGKKLWLLEDAGHRCHAWIVRLDEKTFRWHVNGRTLQGETDTKPKAMKKVEEQVGLLVR